MLKLEFIASDLNEALAQMWHFLAQVGHPGPAGLQAASALGYGNALGEPVMPPGHASGLAAAERIRMEAARQAGYRAGYLAAANDAAQGQAKVQAENQAVDQDFAEVDEGKVEAGPERERDVQVNRAIGQTKKW